MTISRKNLRYCQVVYNSRYYDVLIAVTDLDEVNDILQEWALNKFGAGATLDLPSALIQNKDITDVLTSVVIDSYAYLKSPSSAYMDMPRYAGISGAFPTLPTTLTAGKYVCPETDVFLYSLTGQDGVFGEYSVAELELTPSAGINFLGISYASGVPVWAFYTSMASIDFSTVIPVAVVLYFGSAVYNIPWGQTGYGLPEKLLEAMDARKGFEIIGSFDFDTDSVSGLYIELGEITVSKGVEQIICDAIDTETAGNDMYLYYKDSSAVWQTTKVTQINNTQYQGSGLASLSAGEFVINQIYRVVDSGKLLLFNVLSGKFSTLQDAINSGEITDIPDNIKYSAVCVGRIIVEQGSTTPLIQKVRKITFGS